MADLPEDLRILLSEDRSYLHVFGPSAPWPFPDGWLEETKARATELVLDPAFEPIRLTGELKRTHLREDAPYLASAFHDLTARLYPPMSIVSGPGANNLAYLMDEFRKEPFSPYQYDSWMFRSRFELPGGAFQDLGDAPDLRELLVGFFRQVLELYRGVEPLEPRRTLIAELFDRVADDPDLLRAHRELPYGELKELWRTELCGSDEAYAVLPEQSENPLELLIWGITRLRAAYAEISAVTFEREQSFDLHLAELLHQVGRTDVPAGLLFAGVSTAQVQEHFDDIAKRHDRKAWIRRQEGWMARACEAGAAHAVRRWLAAAYLVGGSLKGLPGWPLKPTDLALPALYLRNLRTLYDLRAAARHHTVTPAGPDPMGELAGMVGLTTVKEQIGELVAEAKVAGLRAGAGMTITRRTRPLLFVGRPGTGKSTVARHLAAAYRQHGRLTSGHVVAVGRAEILAGGTGQAAANVRSAVARAVGGLLYVDEVHRLAKQPEALSALVQAMDEQRDDLVVVLASYPDAITELLDSHPALRSRVQRVLNFPDYTDGELLTLFRTLAGTAGYVLADDLADRVPLLLRRLPRAIGFGNARAARSLLEQISVRQAVRIAALADPTPEQVRELLADDLPLLASEGVGVQEPATTRSALEQLDQLVGLSEVKDAVRRLTAEAEAEVLRAKAGMKPVEQSRHMVFVGNPGTGKTTVARLVAEIYRDLGLLGSGQLVEVTRGDLIAQYIGQTAPKVRQVVESAIGGVLFIDEAYALADSTAYSAEAIATLVQQIELHRTDLVVVLAGYSKEMKTLLDANSGLRSRFPVTLRFGDYSVGELVEIFRGLADDAGFTLGDGVGQRVGRLLGPLRGQYGFGNGREARSVFEATVARQATRIAEIAEPSQAQLAELVPADVPSYWREQSTRLVGQYL
ncbi:AAA family ATPase [Kribbella lupini]|uniref:AAA+ ATPase domain-containing protein n=1 Tax=Kribbella lupini TaxID=291602 RepID=A0ABN2B1D8_9ACTN